MTEQQKVSEPIVRDVTSRGARLRCTVFGSGSPLVLVHDFLSSAIAWSPTISLFAESHRVVVPDLPGFGDSEKPPPEKYAYRPESFAESIMDLTAAIGIDRFALCGEGLGGAVALAAAANHPARVSRLVVVNPVVYASGLEPLFRVATLPIVGPIAFKQLLGRGFFRRHMSRAIGPLENRDGTLDHLFDQFNSPAAREAAYATMISVFDPRTISAAIPRVHAPTLVVWGRNRKYQPMDHGRRLSRELQKGRLHVVDDQGSPVQTSPAAFVDEVRRFLSSKGSP